MIKSQMLKGLLEGCVLNIISRGETYGYEITSVLGRNGFEFINEASVYTVLMRLTKKGLIRSEIRESLKGPKRKYFFITDEGTIFLNQFEKDWKNVSKNISNILKGVEQND